MVPKRIKRVQGIEKAKYMTGKSKLGDDEAAGRRGDFTEKPLSDKIGNNLKQLYDDVVNEAIPDDFLKLLQQADNEQD